MLYVFRNPLPLAYDLTCLKTSIARAVAESANAGEQYGVYLVVWHMNDLKMSYKNPLSTCF
jgi:hypothetical protein